MSFAVAVAHYIVRMQEAANAASSKVLSEHVAKELAGVKEDIAKEVAGVKEGVAKEVAGVAKEVDAKLAGIIKHADHKAEATTHRVLKDYNVRARPRSRHGLAQHDPPPPLTPRTSPDRVWRRQDDLWRQAAAAGLERRRSCPERLCARRVCCHWLPPRDAAAGT